MLCTQRICPLTKSFGSHPGHAFPGAQPASASPRPPVLLACIPSYRDFHWALLTQLSPLTCRALGRRRMVAMFPTGLPLSSDSSVLKDGSFKVQIPQTSRLYYRHEAEFRTLCALRWREDKWISVPPAQPSLCCLCACLSQRPPYLLPVWCSASSVSAVLTRSGYKELHFGGETQTQSTALIQGRQ